MKKINIIKFSILIVFFTVGCNESTEILPQPTQEDELKAQEKESSKNSRTSCDFDLENDGYKFTSGEGKPAGSYNTMIGLLDNNYTEPLPANCQWFGNYLQTAVIERTFINIHCESADMMNNYLTAFKVMAQMSRPSSEYRIIDYQLQSTLTWSGHFKLKIRVIYRKSICGLSGNGSGIN